MVACLSDVKSSVLLRISVVLFVSLLPAAARADAEGDRMLKESLLRQYTSSEADRRFDEYQRNPDAATKALGSGLSNLVSRMYQRELQRQAVAEQEADIWNTYWFAIDSGKEVTVSNENERRILIEMLETNSKKGYWRASQRLVEYALWLHPDGPTIFPGQPRDDEAALILRRKAYWRDDKRELWAVNMLAKLYLVGRGVEKDEEEALRLFNWCANDKGENRIARSDEEDQVTIRTRCSFNAARMVEKGWGVDADPAKAKAMREQAAAFYNSKNKSQHDVAKLEEMIRP
jgi:hypothetical protein